MTTYTKHDMCFQKRWVGWGWGWGRQPILSSGSLRWQNHLMATYTDGLAKNIAKC